MRRCSHFYPLFIFVKGQVRFMYHNITPFLATRFRNITRHSIITHYGSIKCMYFIIWFSSSTKRKKFVANKCTCQSPWFNLYLSLKRRGMREKQIVACGTEQTHNIRVYGLCDGERFAVPWLQIFLKTREIIRYYNLCNAPCFLAPRSLLSSVFLFSLSRKSLTAISNHCKCN